ncbi:hypothetical protein O5D80_005282 [Batrachochytrium dendrobatidis]|nr:hypothetical protein O5D80_005282 [Batrachochytrium dendrobatidis]
MNESDAHDPPNTIKNTLFSEPESQLKSDTAVKSTIDEHASSQASSNPGNPSEMTMSAIEARKLRRKSSIGNRRVSFAATAHVRLFDKDSDDWLLETKNPSDELGVDREFFGESDSTVGFQMPDLVSVRRSSLYDLGMSLSNGINGDVTSQVGSPMNESNTSIDISSDAQQSFEVSTKGSPNILFGMNHYNAAKAAEESTISGNYSLSSDDMDLTAAHGTIISNQSITKLAELLRKDESTPRISGRSTYSVVASPDIVDSPLNSRFSRRDSIAPFFISLKNQLEAIPPLSPRRNQSPAPVSVSKSAVNRRDSVACFFQNQTAPSPLAKSTLFQDVESGAYSDDLEEEASQMMDLASEIGEVTPSQESHYMSVSNTMSLDCAQDTLLSNQELKMSVDEDPTDLCDMSLDIVATQSSTTSMDTGNTQELTMSQSSMDISVLETTKTQGLVASHTNTKFANIVDTNDTITRFFSAPASSTTGNISSEFLASREQSKPEISTYETTTQNNAVAVSTPVRRVMSRQTGQRKSPAPDMPTKSPRSGVSKKQSTPAILKSVLKKTPSTNKEMIELTPTAVHFDVGSPITRSRSKTMKSPAIHQGLTFHSASKASTNSLHKKLVNQSATSTPLATRSQSNAAVSSPVISKSESRRKSRKSISAKKLDIFSPEENVESASYPDACQIEQTLESPVALDTSLQMLDDDTAKEEQQLDIPDIEDEDNLLDEHMSVVESSFFKDTEAISVGQIKTLKEFLLATGIEFMGSLTTRLRRDTNAFQSNSECPTIHEYLKATCLYFPELEIYEFACRELTQSINDGNLTLQDIEESATKNPPLIFFEYEHASHEERDDMINSLRLSKSYARLEAKQSWYSWRGQLIDPMQAALGENCKRFSWDKLLMDEYVKQFSILNESATTYRDTLRQKTIEMQTAQAKAIEIETARVAELTKLQAEQIAELEHLTRELEDLRLQSQEETASIAQANVLIAELVQDIAKYEEVSKDLMVFDPEELPHLRHEYKTIVLTHLWRPLEISMARHIFVFDDVVEVAFYKQGNGYSLKLALLKQLKESKLSKTWLQTQTGFQVVDGIGAQNIQDILDKYEQLHSVFHKWPQMKQVLDDIAYTFENLKVFWREFEQTRHMCPLISIEQPAKPGSSLSVRCPFFAFSSKTRFHLQMGFGDGNNDGLFHYPCGLRSSQFELQYGNISSETLLSAIANVDMGNTVSGMGLLPSLCLAVMKCIQ